METGLLILFFYGVLHSFGPDHLVVIANFSIGKQSRQAFLNVLMFACGHGLMLFVFAQLLALYHLPLWLTNSGELIAASAICLMGIYLLYMSVTGQIQFRRHEHHGEPHVHIWFGKAHQHKRTDGASALALGALMGIGGVRGMLVTLGMVNGVAIDLTMVAAFVAGVLLCFSLFGALVLLFNRRVLTRHKNVNRVFFCTGSLSLATGLLLIGT
ncbi:ABC-type nickel/cobalt efflux system, permease component RcnA [Ferrimonas sediminum]|uniref:ABC-type nickel/cobalt efflux system, permease component RcnA n=1 Tax=Ferrimonas sediminum TaxID=718193 RepID=A0A1G8LXT7_9GAMM|nr:hypothetical protein [Ferrimonas sediminum]SDI60552.1 ABC-type nickel/cobalt efflux system, permease component RcnA [Ferrimonas sediminum]